MHSVVIGHYLHIPFSFAGPIQGIRSGVSVPRHLAWGRDFQFPFVQNLPRVPESHDPTFKIYLILKQPLFSHHSPFYPFTFQ